MINYVSLVQLALLVLLGYSSIVASVEGEKSRIHRRDVQLEVTKQVTVGKWGLTQEDLPVVDTSILPDYWESHVGMLFEVDARVPTNGAEPPEQLVKVTDRKHKFPVFATICSISFLATVITLLIICTN